MLWQGFQRPKKLSVNSDTLTETYGRFSAQPFERGFGTTIGNSLRRALLSSIEGAAITAVRLAEVPHEFSSIPGVVEDATDIILNLKQIPFKLHGDGSRLIRLRVTEPGEVTSGAIEVDSDVEILDPDVHIATVSYETVLDIEMRVKLGRGYVSAEKNYEEDLAVGFIPIDSVHSPVHRVKYAVEQARLGQTTDFERLNLELWTNGAVTPQDAIGLAARLLRDHLQIFINFEDELGVDEEVPELEGDLAAERFNMSIDDLTLSLRSFNCLKNANIQTVGDLVTRTEGDMMNVKNFGRKSLKELQETLQALGLDFGMLQDERGRLVHRRPAAPLE